MIYHKIEDTLALVNLYNNMAITEEQRKALLSNETFMKSIGKRVKSEGKLDITSTENLAEQIAARKAARTKQREEEAKQETAEGRSTIDQLKMGAGKGVISTLTGASSLGERFLRGTLKTILPKSVERKLGIEDKEFTPAAERLIPEELRTPTTAKEQVGFTAEQIAEFFIPGGVATKGTKLGKLAKAGITGAEVAGRVGMQEGEIGKEAITAGVATPIIGGVLTKTGEALFQSLPKRLVQKAIGQSKKELLAGKDVSRFALDKKKFGTAKGILAGSESEVTRLSEEIAGRLKSVPVTAEKVSVKKIANDVAGEINSAGGEVSAEEVLTIVNKLAPQAKSLLGKPTMGLDKANGLRQSIDKTLGDRGFLTSQLPYNKEVLRSFTNMLRNEVKDKAPKGTRELFDELSNEIRLRNAILENVTKDQLNNSFGFTDFLTFGSFGATSGLVPGIAAVGVKKGLQSTPFLTGAGITLEQINKVGPILEKLTPAERGVLSEIIKKLLEAASAE